MPDVPSLSLGTGLVTPLELTAAFAVFPNGGVAVRPRAILRVSDADGGVVLANAPDTERVLSPQTAFQMVSMLEDVIDRGTGAAARTWGVRFPAGGKTGTTNEFKDAWFVGFSSSIAVGVWVGFDQPKTIGRGLRRALRPCLGDFMRRAVQRPAVEEFEIPSGLNEEQLCRVSLPAAGRGVPGLHEYLRKRRRPESALSDSPGTMKQRVRRAVQGFLSVWARSCGISR